MGSGVANASCHRKAVFDEGHGDSELGNAGHEFAGAVKGIDDPHPSLFQAGKIIDTFFR
jgi:hypothetical protein